MKVDFILISDISAAAMFNEFRQSLVKMVSKDAENITCTCYTRFCLLWKLKNVNLTVCVV